MARSASTVYVGCYTAPHTAPDGVGPSTAEGVGVIALDPATGALEPLGVGRGVENPSWVVLHPSRPLLYAVCETESWQGRPGTGGVAAFSIADDGGLELLGTQASCGEGPACAAVDEQGCHVVVASYNSGTLAVLPIGADGGVGPATDVVWLHGHGPNQQRQASPHPHGVTPVGGQILVPDLGTDTVRRYAVDHATGTLLPQADAGYARQGGGARHVAASVDGRSLYLVEEMGSALLVLDLDAGRPGDVRQVLPMVPPWHDGPNLGAEVLVHPAGFVFATNRGHDGIARYQVAEGGDLELLGWTPSNTSFVRHATLAAGDALLLAAGQNSDSIVAFHVDAGSGDLEPTGAVTRTSTPVCVVERPSPS